MTKNRELTLGSLFSGSGGFELGGQLAGIKPIWNSEVEPFCVAVTRKNFPCVKHYGDINELSGADLEPVDIITWGSPCQDLSIAGKRAGLSGSRSGLYVEAVRIVKEMLEVTDGKYPKFCVFENVPGLLSSNGGADFYACLDMMQELGFLPDANILDAQFMGVPQRRKRVYITWVQVDYILQKRTPISDSITLQLLTEILQMNLAGLLRAYGIELKKSVANVRNQSGNGVKRRMNLFSLQREDRLRMLQMRLDEMQVTHSKEQSDLDSNLGEDPMAEIISTAGDMKSECLTTGNQSWSIGQSLKSALEDGLQIENGSITSIWTRETIVQKICTCFQALLNTLDVTTNLMHSLEKEPMSLNCFEWVKYSLTEVKEFINAARKYEKSTGRLVGDDLLRIYEQRVREAGDWIEQNFADQCGREILPQSESLPWNSKKSVSQGQRTAGSSPACIGTPSLCLNDQGGQRMDVTDDVTSTLRAEAHHPPCVMSAGFCTEHSANARGIGYEEERSPTLRAGVVPAVVPLENHPTDSRIKIQKDGKVQTLSNRMGTGGNNVPLLMEEQVPITLKIRSGCAGGGKGQLCQVDKSATLGCNNDQTLFVPEQESCYWDGGQTAGTLTEKNARGTQRMPDKDNFNCVLESSIPKAYGISSYMSNAMLSDNPHSGIYEAETSRTLDTGGGNPDCNQGGVAIVEKAYSIQGNLIGRDDKNGPQGCGINEDVSFTLNTTDHHAVYPISREEPKYTVRRLTPTECARLQGFPDWWCHDLGNPNPTDEELKFWVDVWETHRRVVSHTSKPKTEKQVRKWLTDPYSDSAEYKLWGNGISLPVAFFVLSGIVWAAEKEEK